MLVLLLGTGINLSIKLRFQTLFRLKYSFTLLWNGRSSNGKGQITPFQALMTSMSGTIGTGNIAGVATAVYLGGPGALFWMWVSALFGMATTYSEAVLSLKYREVDEKGSYRGGPMYYIKNGIGKKWTWLSYTFAFLGATACLGIGNTVQANSIAQVLSANFNFPPLMTGLIVMLVVALVLIGGIKRIGAIAGTLVPFMASIYILCGLLILLLHIDQLADAIYLIIDSAFNPLAATGGFAGSTIMLAVRFGIARGIFSNEAGLGISPIAHATAQTNEPVKQGLIAMLGTFIDTLILCSITGLVIVVTGSWQSGESGAVLTSLAFETALPNIGNYIIAFGLSLFALTTIIGWSFYGERCAEFLFGSKVTPYYRLFYILVIPIGATINLNLIWLIADTLNALMAIPNLIALFILSPVVYRLTNDYFQRHR